jgi:hypothetical protein
MRRDRGQGKHHVRQFGWFGARELGWKGVRKWKPFNRLFQAFFVFYLLNTHKKRSIL